MTSMYLKKPRAPHRKKRGPNSHNIARRDETRELIMAEIRKDLALGNGEIAERTGLHPVTVRNYRLALFKGEPYLTRDVKTFITERGLIDEFLTWVEARNAPKQPRDAPRFTSAHLLTNPELLRDL